MTKQGVCHIMAASVIIPEGGPRYGSFIYQVLNPEGIAVWGAKNDEKSTSVWRLEYDDLFEVDWIPAKEAEQEGSRRWMRLADGSGWINADNDEGMCKEVTSVEDGLWKFYSFCTTGNLVVYNQPSDRPELQSDQILWPFQKVFCDKRVKSPSGMTFYRIQGSHGWVYSSKNDNLCLFPDMLVSAKLQVFQALEDQEITFEPTADNSPKGTDRKVLTDNLVAIDHSIVIPNDKGDGPFLRLADNSGWLMVSRNGKTAMTQVPVQDGLWDFQVENDPEGVTLMNQPLDSEDNVIKTDVKYNPFQRIQCDKEVQLPNSTICFYRVKGTNGWIPDRRLLPSQNVIRPDELVEHPMLSLITCHDELADSTKRGSAGQEYNGDADTDDEETWRQALNKLEIEYADHRNHMLQRIHALDLLHSSKACRQAKEQAARLEELYTTKRRHFEETKLIEEQLEKFQKKQDIERARKNRGDKFEFQIFSASKITLSSTDLMFAMGGAATLAVNESRILRYTDGLPKDMLHLLEKETLALPLASLVALGSEDRYFIRFANDKMERWCVKNVELEAILMVETVDFVAFGSSSKSFVTKSPTGMKWSCIPEELETILKEERPIHSVSLGPNGEYFVAWKDGACTGGRWNGSKIDEALDRLKEGGWHIRDMKFGAESTFIIRYSDYDGPF